MRFLVHVGKPPATYRYDSSLSPSLEWDGKNPVREHGEWLLALIDEAAKLPAPADPELEEAERVAKASDVDSRTSLE